MKKTERGKERKLYFFLAVKRKTITLALTNSPDEKHSLIGIENFQKRESEKLSFRIDFALGYRAL